MIRPSVTSSAATAMIEVKRRHRPAQPRAEPGARTAGRGGRLAGRRIVAALVRRCRNRVRMLLTVGYRVSAGTAAANASPRWP